MLSPLPLLAKGLGTGWPSTCGSGARFTLCKGWKPPAGTELALLGAFLIFCLLHSFTTVRETCCIAGKKPCNFIASESVSSQLFSRGGGQPVKRQSSSRALGVGHLRPNGTSQGVGLVRVSQDAQLITGVNGIVCQSKGNIHSCCDVFQCAAPSKHFPSQFVGGHWSPGWAVCTGYCRQVLRFMGLSNEEKNASAFTHYGMKQQWQQPGSAPATDCVNKSMSRMCCPSKQASKTSSWLFHVLKLLQ